MKKLIGKKILSIWKKDFDGGVNESESQLLFITPDGGYLYYTEAD